MIRRTVHSSLYLAVSLFLALFAGLILGTNAEAAETSRTDVTFVIHQLRFEDEQKIPKNLTEDGSAQDALLQDYEGVNDIEFSAFDVTERFNHLLTTAPYKDLPLTKAREQISEKLSQSDLTQWLPVAKKVTVTEGNEDGIAKFILPAKASEKDKIYLFAVSGHPKEIELKEEPFAVILPIRDTADKELQEIHLYPKGIIGEAETVEPTLDKQVISKEKSYGYGDLISFKTAAAIPADAADHQSYQIADKADDSLWMVKKDPPAESIVVTASPPIAEPFYTVAGVDDHGFTIDFKPEVLAEHSGTVLTFTYQMELRGNEAEKSTFANNTDLLIDHEPKYHDQETVETGGKRFVKVDLNNEAKKLSGAQFVIRNGEGKYLKRADDKNTWAANPENDGVLRLTSDAQGMFSINGLPYGDYQLFEIRAPDGYVRYQDTIPFTAEGTYSENDAQVLKVMNKSKAPPSDAGKTPEEPLMKTNELSSPVLAVLGIVIVAIVTITYLKRRKRE